MLGEESFIISDKKNVELRQKYRQDALFLACTATLNQLKRKHEIPFDDVTAWHVAECVMLELQQVEQGREFELPHLHTELLLHYERELSSSPELAYHAVAVILFILFLQISACDPQNGQPNPHEALLSAIVNEVLSEEEECLFFKKLRFHVGQESVTKRKEPIVIPPTDYMHQEPVQPLTEQERMLQKILERTKCLEVQHFLRISWDTYCHLWEQICANDILFSKLKVEKPRGNPWKCNLMMVLNVLGMLSKTTFLNHRQEKVKCIDAADRKIANYVLTTAYDTREERENRHPYVGHPVPSPPNQPHNSDSAFTPQQYAHMQLLIDQWLKSEKLK